jgi:hypothetical protein
MQKVAAFVIAWLKVHWAEILVWLFLLAILILIGWIFWRRFGEGIITRAQSFWQRLTRVPEIPSDALTRIWREFKREIPPKLRRAVRRYPIFVVIGDHGCGKTTLIDIWGHLDVQRLRYHGSSTDSNLMQAHLGNNEIILEISSNFLYSTDKDHANALLALWSQLPQGTTIILTIDARGLLSPDVDQQSRIINALVSKFALFNEASERPIPVRIALSHMDEIEGFPPFYAFAANSGLDIHVEIENGSSGPAFAHGLDHYLQYLSNFLVGLSSRDFMASMGFLSHIREVLGALQNQLNAALERHEVKGLTLDSVCLISYGDRDLQLGLESNDPFRYVPQASRFSDVLSPKHLRWATRLGAAGLALILFNYTSERLSIERAADLVQSIPGLTAQEYAIQAHPHFAHLQNSHHHGHSFDFFHLGARYYPTQARIVGLALAKSIRTHYLLPGLKLAQSEPHVYAMTVRWLALIHANATNQLGAFYMKEGIDTGIQLPYELIHDYVSWNIDLKEPQILNLENEDYGMLAGRDVSDRPWPRLAQLLDFSARDTYITQSELVDIQNAARDLQGSVNSARAFPQLDEQILWLSENGHISNNTRQYWKDSPSDGQLESDALKRSLDLIVSSAVNRGEQPQNIMQVLELIQKLMNDYKDLIAKNTLGVVGTTINGHYYSFDTNRWYQLMLRSQVKEILTSYYALNYSNTGWIFFNPQAQAYRVPLGISTDISGGLVNNAQVDIRLTRESFEQKVKPAIILLTTMVGEIPLQNQDKQALIDFFVSNLTIYAGNYADAYWGFFKNMIIRVNSPDNLEAYLRELQRPGSAFVQNLMRIKENVLLDIPTDPNFQPVRDRLADFQFMQKLMQEQAGSYPQLQRYIALSGELLDHMSKDEALPPAGMEKPGPDAGLKKVLTPLGRVSYEMLNGGSSSLLYRVEAYLRELNIPASWQGPFVVPFQKAREFGRQEANTTLYRQWQQLWDTQVVPLLSCFPFEYQKSTTTQDCEPDQIQLVFHPLNGTFWSRMKEVFGGLFQVSDSQWKPRQDIVTQFMLPENMLRRLEAASALTQALWTKEGANQPLVFKVKPELLPEITVMNEEGQEVPMPSLAFLRSPGSSVLGFNQKKAWQDFNFEWWQKSQVSAGIEFVSPTEKTRKYASTDIDDSRWAFFRLLMTSDRSANWLYTWRVIHPEKPDKKLSVSFTLKKDPFELFSAIKQR